MFLPVIVNSTVLLDSTSMIIEDGADRASEIYLGVEEFIAACNVPEVRIKRQRLAPSLLGALLGDRRDCLTVINTLDSDLRTFAVHITANDYGSALVVNWWLCARLGFWRTLVEKAGYWLESKPPPVPLTAELDLFQKDILMKGFVTVVFTALQRAVEEVMQGLGQDISDLESKSGFVI